MLLLRFDMNRYNAIVKYKTSYYSFFLPVALAMNMAGIKDSELYLQSKRILLEMGHFFQVTRTFRIFLQEYFYIKSYLRYKTTFWTALGIQKSLVKKERIFKMESVRGWL